MMMINALSLFIGTPSASQDRSKLSMKEFIPLLNALRVVLVGLTFALSTQIAGAISITEIDIPITGATYYVNGNFTVSGRPASNVNVFYNDGRIPNPKAYDFTIFSLSTIGMQPLVSASGKQITYSGGLGNISILDGNNFFSPLLTGQLSLLSMEIINPALGAFEGSGQFNVTGGSLASDFGANGGLATIGIAFTVPADFKNGFAALANTTLYPTTAPHVPDGGSTVTLLGVALIGLQGLRRRLIALRRFA